MATTRPASLPHGVTVEGPARFLGTVALPANSIGDGNVSPNDPLDCDKVRHQYAGLMAQPHGTAATAQRQIVRVVQGAGEIVSVNTTVSVAATGDSKVTIDVKKNGTTVLDSTYVIDNGDAAYDLVPGDLVASPTVAAGDVIEVVQTVSLGTGTLPQGVATVVEFREDPGA
jgi:hypothetical protein